MILWLRPTASSLEFMVQDRKTGVWHPASAVEDTAVSLSEIVPYYSNVARVHIQKRRNEAQPWVRHGDDYHDIAENSEEHPFDIDDSGLPPAAAQAEQAN